MIPDKIILHHSLTKDGKEVSWGAIRYYHMTAPEYMMKDIGYHAGIELVQSGDYLYYEILMGRMWDELGAHAKGQNYCSLGLCFIGNYDLIEPPNEILIVGAKLLRYWLVRFGLTMNDIHRHSEYADKTCPGTKFDLEKLKALI